MRTETDPVSETLCSLVFRITDDGQSQKTIIPTYSVNQNSGPYTKWCSHVKGPPCWCFLMYCHVFRGSVTNNNGLWIGWLDLLIPSVQLQSIIAAHNQWSSKTHSIPYWTRSVFHCDWLGSDLRICHFFSFHCQLVNTPQMNTELLIYLLNSLTTECRITAHLQISWTELSHQLRGPLL
jgi:hypothetical protein